MLVHLSKDQNLSDIIHTHAHAHTHIQHTHTHTSSHTHTPPPPRWLNSSPVFLFRSLGDVKTSLPYLGVCNSNGSHRFLLLCLLPPLLPVKAEQDYYKYNLLIDFTVKSTLSIGFTINNVTINNVHTSTVKLKASHFNSDNVCQPSYQYYIHTTMNHWQPVSQYSIFDSFMTLTKWHAW